MLEKLKRDASGLSGAVRREDAIDWVISCAFTAWHIVDWAWVTKFENDHQARKVLEAGQTDLPSNGSNKFKERLARMSSELALCRDITINFKHPAAGPPGETKSIRLLKVTTRPKVVPSGEYSIEDGTLSGPALGGAGFVQGDIAYCVVITDTDGNEHEAVSVFCEVIAFWTCFMDEWGIK